MKKTVVFSAALFASAAFSPAFAASAGEQVEMCAAALTSNGSAPEVDYRAKFKKSRGGSTKTVTIDLLPMSGGEKLTGVCKIKGGEVIEARVKA